jgi:hypothetical protein
MALSDYGVESIGSYCTGQYGCGKKICGRIETRSNAMINVMEGRKI